jgi:hypothetical protein
MENAVPLLTRSRPCHPLTVRRHHPDTPWPAGSSAGAGRQAFRDPCQASGRLLQGIAGSPRFHGKALDDTFRFPSPARARLDWGTGGSATPGRAGATPREPEGSGKPGERVCGGDGPGDLHPGSDRTRDPGSGRSARLGDLHRHGDRPVRHPSGRDVHRAAQHQGKADKAGPGRGRDPSRKKGGRGRRMAGRKVKRLRRGTADARRDSLRRAQAAIGWVYAAVVAGSAPDRAIPDRRRGLFRSAPGWRLAGRGGRPVRAPLRHAGRSCPARGSADAGNRISRAGFRRPGCGCGAAPVMSAAPGVLAAGRAATICGGGVPGPPARASGEQLRGQ